MNQRLSELENVYFSHLVGVLRAVGGCMPFAVVGFGLLVREGYLDRSYYAGDTVFFTLSALFVIVAFAQWRNRSSQVRPQIVISGLQHILAALFLLLVTGIFSPFIICWILLFVGTDIYFGNRGAVLNMLALLATFLVSTITQVKGGETNDVAVSLTVLFVVLVSFIISKLRQVTETERRAYNKIRRSESLQKERLTTLINAMGDAVISTDEKGVIRIYNAAALNLLDTNATLSGQTIDKALNIESEDGTPFSLMKYVHANDHVFSRRDLLHRYSKSDTINLYINVSPIRPNYEQRDVQSGYIFILRDITKEKSLEEERDEFISVVSHELRTPIAIMEGNISNTQLVLSRPGKLDNKMLETALGSAHEQSIYLAKMINDLSTLSRAERGVADEAETIAVDTLMHALYSEYQPQAEKKCIRLDLDIGHSLGTVSASRLYLEEVLQNFITNAIKYTQEGAVTIHAKKKNGSIEFAVSDSGIGISKSDLKKIFEKFYRSEDYRTRETSGTGLGLYVVQKLAHKLKTIVKVTSRLNHGSTFSFKLKADQK